jgi:hypothetical protein
MTNPAPILGRAEMSVVGKSRRSQGALGMAGRDPFRTLAACEASCESRVHRGPPGGVWCETRNSVRCARFSLGHQPNSW